MNERDFSLDLGKYKFKYDVINKDNNTYDNKIEKNNMKREIVNYKNIYPTKKFLDISDLSFKLKHTKYYENNNYYIEKDNKYIQALKMDDKYYIKKYHNKFYTGLLNGYRDFLVEYTDIDTGIKNYNDIEIRKISKIHVAEGSIDLREFDSMLKLFYVPEGRKYMEKNNLNIINRLENILSDISFICHISTRDYKYSKAI